MSSYFASPIPLTFFISSILLNFPFSFLYSIIRKANDGPIPGNVSNSVWVAVFIFTILLCASIELPDVLLSFDEPLEELLAETLPFPLEL